MARTPSGKNQNPKAPTTQPKKPKKPGQDPVVSSATNAAFKRYLKYLTRFQGYQSAGINKFFPKSGVAPTYNPQQLRTQAQQALQGIFGPRQKSIEDSFKRQLGMGAKAITGYTGTYANRLGQIPISIANANAQGLQQQAAVGGALADYMRDTGSHIADDLTQRLSDANLSAGQIEGTVGNAADTGFIGSGEIAGLNASSLMRMADEGNAWLKWGQALPGIGILQGQQELGQFVGGLGEAYAQQMGDMRSDMAQQGVQLYQNLLDRNLDARSLNLQRSSAMAGLYGDAQQRGLNAALGGAGLLQNWAQMLLDRELGMAGINADLYGTQAGIYSTDVGAQQAAADRAAAAQQAAADRASGANYPGDIKTKEDLRGGMHADAVQFFTSTNLRTLTPNLSNARKKVMSFLRGQNAGPFRLSDQELQRLRDQILATLGYNFTKAPPRVTGTTGPMQSPDAQGAGDEGYNFPWGLTTLIPGFLGG